MSGDHPQRLEQETGRSLRPPRFFFVRVRSEGVRRYRRTVLTTFERVIESLRALVATRMLFVVVVTLNVCVLSAVGLAAFASVASAPVTTQCSDFSTWQQAADYWESHIEDVRVREGLDSNGNLIPCETLVDGPGADLMPVDMRYVCDDFDYWEQAQSWFDAWVGDYPELRSLDRDGNGVACQSIPAFGDIVSVVKRLNRLERSGLR